MAKIKLFDPHSISKREALIDIVFTLLFLLLQGTFVGINGNHIFVIVLFNVLYFAHPMLRKLAVALLPFAVFGMSYDWMRIYPNYKVNPIDIQELYETEKALFGIATEGGTLIPGEYFNLHNSAVADFFAGIFYLCWVPGPMAFGLWLFFKGERKWYLRFALAFLFVNIVGFIGYYIHPAAPPWYAINYGFEPDFSTPGNTAGLDRFDNLIGFPIFASIYVNNSNIFAAIPSLHAAYMLITTIYAVKCRQPKPLIAVCAIITLGIWWTAVYSCHHYIIDVLLGILTAVVGVGLFEVFLMRLTFFKRFIQSYTKYIS
jgi:membrane-associated phospholipid phosphatase